MNYSAERLWSMLKPFLAMGVFIVILVAGVILVFQLLLWGLILGLILFIGSFIKHKLTERRLPLLSYDESAIENRNEAAKSE